MCNIRLLKPDEIEVRSQQITDKGGVLLLYKNSRTDMSILDETFGMFGWQREHAFKEGHNYCRVSIWDKDKGQWIHKEDVGIESNAEAEKGEASDAFKRACFNIGIGRELYTSPFIWVSLNPDELYQNQKTQKWQLKAMVRFRVESIEYDKYRNIIALKIVDQNGNLRFKYPRMQENVSATPSTTTQQPTPTAKAKVTMDMLDDEIKCDCLLRWAYNFWTTTGYDPTFDAGARLLKSYDAKDVVVNRFKALFESYKSAIKNDKK